MKSSEGSTHVVRDQVKFTRSATFNCDILPALGAGGDNQGRYRSIHPYNPLYRYWQNFLVFLVIYTAWMSPFETCFININSHHKLWAAFTIADTVVDFFFLIDINLTFFVAYVDRTTHLLETKPSKIASKYLKSGFVLDVASTLPLQTFLVFMNNRRSVLYGALNMLRFWRLWRVSDFFKRLERDIRFNYYWIRSLKLLCITVFNIHCAGCFFFLLAELHPNGQDDKTWIGAVLPNFREQSPWVCYIYSMYWAMTTLASVGYGDIHPMNTWEMAFDTAYMLFNLGLIAYLIGNMTNLVVHLTSTTRKFRDSANAITMFACRNQLPKRLHEEMLDHVRIKQKSESLKHDEIMDSLPKAIRCAVSQHLFLSTIDNVYLFRGTSYDFRVQLVSEMKADYFAPGQNIILQNEVPDEFYIVASGTVDVIHCSGAAGSQESVIKSAKAGDVVGEIGVLCFTPQPFTIRAKSISQLLRINRASFRNIVQGNVADGKVVIHNLYEHMRDSQIPHLTEFIKEIENDTHLQELASRSQQTSLNAQISNTNNLRIPPNSPLVEANGRHCNLDKTNSSQVPYTCPKSTKSMNFEQSLFGIIASPFNKAACNGSLQQPQATCPKRVTIFQLHPARKKQREKPE